MMLTGNQWLDLVIKALFHDDETRRQAKWRRSVSPAQGSSAHTFTKKRAKKRAKAKAARKQRLKTR